MSRRGRKRNTDAKRHQATRDGRKHRTPAGASEAAQPGFRGIAAKRVEIAGDERIGLDFPLDVLQARRFITAAMRDEGLRFAVLGWALFGFPLQSCEGLYERMVADGVGADLIAPRVEGEDPDKDAIGRSQRAAYDRMARALGWRRDGPISETFIAVREAAQYCQLPRLVVDQIEGRPGRTDAFSEMAALVAGLKALVRLQERRAAPRKDAAVKEAKIAAIAREERRLTDRRCVRGWFSGPLVGPLPEPSD